VFDAIERNRSRVLLVPVYLFTFHAYRSWNANRPRGFVRRGLGVLPPSKNLATAYDRAAVQPPVLFDANCQRVLIWIAYDVCRRRGWRLHAAATEGTHVHYLMSWRDRTKWLDASLRLKNVASLLLNRKRGSFGRRNFSGSGSRKRVRDRQHFDYLMRTYLPRHRGLFWREGNAPPSEPPGFAAPVNVDPARRSNSQ